MKTIALGILVFSLSAQAANSFDLGIVPASDSLQAKLEALLQQQFEEEEKQNVDLKSRSVRRTAAGAYVVDGSNGKLECQEYGPKPDEISIQIQTFGCKIDLK